MSWEPLPAPPAPAAADALASHTWGQLHPTLPEPIYQTPLVQPLNWRFEFSQINQVH